MSDTIKGFRGKDGPILLDYSGVANVPGAIQSIGTLTAQPGDHFEVETVNSTGRVATVKAVEKPGGGSGQNQNQMEPMDGDIPKVFLTGDEFGSMNTTKNEVSMGMEYISKTDRFKAAIKIKFQGSSSLFFSKKNYTIKMYTDDSYESKLKKSFRDWGHSSNKYVLKANFIDHSHARNIISARLWDEIVASRPDYDSLPAEMRNSPRNGAIDGFPVKLYVNGTYQGVYTWNIGKDDWMWGMDEDNPNHVLLCGESHGEQSSSCFRSLWNGVDENDWAVEVGTNSTALKNSLNALIQFIMDNNGADFKAGIGNYLDIQSAIDYYILHYEICAYDCMARNMLLATFDGTKWICGAYDLDSTYGLTISGGIGIASNYACPEDYKSKYSLLWERLEANYADELKARQSELRKTVLAYSNMVAHFERFMDAIGSDLYAEDLTIYTDIPSGSTNNIKQIRNFIRDRQAYVDAEFAKMENFVPVYCTGISLSATELTFTGAGTQTLTATVTPDGCTDSVIWESDDTSIATVRGGVVTAKANGSATITARCGAYTATCAVSISGVAEPVLCTGISLDKTSLVFTASGTQTLVATVTPDGCTEEVTWESSDDGVATVVGGVVTAVSDGDAAITARCGGYSAVCSATVAIASNRDIITLTETTTELPMTLGKLDDNSGEVVENQDCYVTNSYIAVAENQSYTVAGTSGQYLRVYGYDAAFKFNRGTQTIVHGSNIARTATFTVPSGVKYIRCQMYHDPGTMTITINE